ncbi:MAG: GntR family transcriptional regulator, partial [Anaerolineae bacterium]|nr:GntR family transcriptional regulator [Anaerolineae bacterium]
MSNPSSLPPFAPASKSTLVESVVEQIIVHIRDRHYTPGDRLPSERALMQMMNVGRSTIREALQSLAAMDLIETRSGSGSVVKDTFSLQRILMGEGGMIDPHHAPSSPTADHETPLPRRPQYTLVPAPPLAEMEAGLQQWAALRPQFLSVDRVGRSLEGLPILLCRVTDATISDEDKQVVLFTTCHSGMERRAVSSLLKLIRWLIGDDPLADSVRRRQIVLVMPVCEPDGYESRTDDNTSYYTGRHKVYVGWTWNGPEDPANQPEAVAIQQVMDTYRPDVHQAVHGMWYAEATQWENTGVSWASNLYRSYVPEIPQQMNDAAERAGFLMCGTEADAGQVLSTVPVPGAERWFFGASSTPRVVAGLYAYYQYHTIAQVMDAGWDESGMIRMRRLLEMGNEVWRGE